MFKKLRNKLIFINLVITSIVIVIVFVSVYVIYIGAASRRPPVPEEKIGRYENEVEDAIEKSIREEKKAAAEGLLTLLIISGIAIEVAVAFVSYYLAEEAIKPVKEAYDNQKIFIANASHEIKTPLAAISANLEAADIKGNKWISNIEKETDKLAALNTELLTLAKTDISKETSKEKINIAKVLDDELRRFEPRLKHIKLIRDYNFNGEIKLNKIDLIQIFNILIDNAIKYGDKKIIVRTNNNTLIVENDGETISDDQKKFVFERFYQIDKTRDGVGLGLSIAKSLADKNGWNIQVKTKNGKNVFCVKF